MSTEKTLPLPAGDEAEIHTIGGHDYLVVRLEVDRKTDWYLAELQGGVQSLFLSQNGDIW